MDNSHELVIDQPMRVVWPALTDLRRVAAALPGAEIQDSSADGWFDGLFRIKLGAFNASFRGKARYRTIDDEAHGFVLEGAGGSAHGDARLTVACQAEERDSTHTVVRLTSSIDLTGRLAQFGSSMADGVLRQLMDAFARNLEHSFAPVTELTAADAAQPGPTTAAAAPPSTDAFDVGGSLLTPIRPLLPAVLIGLLGVAAGLLIGRWAGSKRVRPIIVHLATDPR
ncbi:SRPBCC domain-containing protein [Nocardioides daejeonensis]|uniref:SRPBCC domain-containing protein n=1 Tax=Nocardioides daejeonensis TaxID=1046556 RepID=UPI000D748620|nr:SRPBCC domain-containing protein [Nocardioides daejeonensis]